MSNTIKNAAMNTKGTIIGSGAEAIVYLEKDVVFKDRISKKYRHAEIDFNLRFERTKHESKILEKLNHLNISPHLINQKIIRQKSRSTHEHTISMEYLKGSPLKELLNTNPLLASHVGIILTQLHNVNIIHGDLTTSNMIVICDAKNNNTLKFIDFGLSFISNRIEDKAVDIHLFKQALESRHHKVFAKAYAAFLRTYNPKNKSEILERLRIVETRGRYKEKH